MPRRLPEKTRREGRRPRGKRGRKYYSIPFQGTSVKAGQEINVIIDDIGSKGDGIARIQGFLVFVPETKVGERLKVRIVNVGRKFAIAEKIK